MLGLNDGCNFRRFLRQTDGTAAMIFALAVIPIMLLAGLAVDFLRTSQSQSQMQAVLDAAVLAVARAEGEPDAQRKGRGIDYFRRNFDMNNYEGKATPNFEIAADRVIGTAELSLPTTLLKLTGHKTWQIAAKAEAMRPITGSAEVAMVLDYSGSMNDNNKYRRMATVAQGFIDNLTVKMNTQAKLQFGLVPFSDVVAYDFPAVFVRQADLDSGEWEKDGSGNWYRDNAVPPVKPNYPKDRVGPNYTGCTQDRRYPLNQSDSPPAIGNDLTKWGEIYHWWTTSVTTEQACSDFLENNLKIEPLTDNYATLKARIGSMQPFKNTNIALGVEFGRHILTPEEPFAALPYNKKDNHKFMIVLTDGMETTNGRGPGQVESIPNALANLSANCTQMKQNGMVIFTIGYDVTDPTIIAQLQGCASPGRFYDADAVGNDLENTFKDIADAIKESLIYLSN
jgi:Flp pilus assembly protein TadG